MNHNLTSSMGYKEFATNSTSHKSLLAIGYLFTPMAFSLADNHEASQ